jgi:hypothetical protein
VIGLAECKMTSAGHLPGRSAAWSCWPKAEASRTGTASTPYASPAPSDDCNNVSTPSTDPEAGRPTALCPDGLSSLAQPTTNRKEPHHD